MGSVSIPTAVAYAAAAASAAGAAYGAYSSHEAGVAASNQAKDKARVEALDAAQKQIGIRQNMLRALASQSASAGVGGIGTGGSFGANVGRQITQNQSDLLVNSANSSAKISLLDQAANNARFTGDANAATGLLDYAGKKFGGGG